MSKQPADDVLAYTGERMVPEGADPDTFWEHIHRYAFAARFAKGKRVLDVACGEGYGSAALREAGSDVIGVDVSAEVCRHALERYGIDTNAADAESLPFRAETFDLVVSFETIEHLNHPEQFLDECARVLIRGGVAIISTPNKVVYNRIDPSNQFHLHELDRVEFESECKSRFTSVQIFTQKPIWAPWWSIRGLAAVSWPTSRIRGVGRLRRILFRAMCLHLSERRLADARNSPVKAITDSMIRTSQPTNPYAVRRQWPIDLDKPVYMIAVCKKR